MAGVGGHRSRKKFGFSGEDFLPSFRQLQSHQASTDEGGEGQEDGDDLGDADEGGKDEAGDDGRKFTDSVQDAERRPPVEAERRGEGGICRESSSTSSRFSQKRQRSDKKLSSNFKLSSNYGHMWPIKLLNLTSETRINYIDNSLLINVLFSLNSGVFLYNIWCSKDVTFV